MKKALLIGTRNCVPYLSLTAAVQTLPELLGCSVESCDETAHRNLSFEKIMEYDLILFMPASWQETGSEAATEALFRYVLHGGNLFFIGNGLNLGDTQELKVITGCVYRGSSYYTELDIEPSVKAAASCGTVTIRTIPHFVKLDVFKSSDVLMTFRYGNAEYPALFAHPWSKGRVACLTLDLTGESIHALAPVIQAAMSYLEN